jgi:hypothetical protein
VNIQNIQLWLGSLGHKNIIVLDPMDLLLQKQTVPCRVLVLVVVPPGAVRVAFMTQLLTEVKKKDIF